METETLTKTDTHGKAYRTRQRETITHSFTDRTKHRDTDTQTLSPSTVINIFKSLNRDLEN